VSADQKESVLSRWSRRKHEAEQGTGLAEESTLITAGSSSDPDAVTVTEEDARPVLTDADMPPVESLNEDSDFSGFMSAGVSDKLRNLALRKLFMAPVFNIRDGLDEYDDDYTTFEKLGDIVTCDMKHHAEMKEKKRLREEMEQEAETEAVDNPDEGEDIEDIKDAEDVEVAEEIADPVTAEKSAGTDAEAQLTAEQDK
jgi:hypothetical protein